MCFFRRMKSYHCREIVSSQYDVWIKEINKKIAIVHMWNYNIIQKRTFMKAERGIRMGYLISETTKEEREQIVAESLGNIEANCDGCMTGLAELYQDYIDGKKELREINMEFNAGFIKGDDVPDRASCPAYRNRF